ncbi:MAG: amidohydrolase family protein [Gammaproteobacteria bacterium]
MPNQGFRVIDSDLHIVEPVDLWQRYIDPAFRDQAPVGRNFGGRFDDLALADGRPILFPSDHWAEPLRRHMEPVDHLYQFAMDRNWDGVSQLQAMDQEGTDVAILFPTRGLYAMAVDVEGRADRGYTPALATAVARAYNDWLHDFCAPDRSRLIGAAMVAPHDARAAAAEVRRAVTELGFRAVFLLPGLIAGRPWHDPWYDPLWAECERLDVPVGFHGGGNDRLTDYGLALGGFEMSVWHTFSHCLGPMAAAASMTAGGVFERFPKLRAAYLEANCSWAPWLFCRLDDHIEDYIGRFEFDLPMKPSEYFRRNCYVSVEADEATVGLYISWFGDDNIVFSSDYPHPDSKFPRATAKFLSQPISEQAKRKILWDNCARLYRIPG